MTNRSLTNALSKIETARKQGFLAEAVVRGFHVNTALMKDLLTHVSDVKLRNKKIKSVYKQFFKEVENNEQLRTLITRQSARQVRTWVDKAEVFFKALKAGTPANSRALADETLKIAGILSISVAKLSARAKKPAA